MDQLISVRLNTDLKEGLEAAAKARSLTRSDLIRKVLEKFMESQPTLRAPKP